jgi:prepilin peptidase CpaA
MPALLKCALVALVVAAAVYDFRFRRIPNWLNLSGFILGIGLNTLLFAQRGLLSALLGLLLALGLYIPLYLLRAMGAGDAKLMAAIGSVVGPHNWLILFVCSALIGGIVALSLAFTKGRLGQTFTNLTMLASELLHFRVPARRHDVLDVRSKKSMRLPHGVSIAAGSLVFLVITPILHS